MEKMKIIYIAVFLYVSSAAVEGTLNSASDEFIENINKQNLTWKAKRYFDKDFDIKILMGVKSDYLKTRSLLRVVTYVDDTTEIPETFDARQKWPKCTSINVIRDQANCGSCWAFAAVEAMTDRICIHSDATSQISVSAQELLTCCENCGDGCNGGYPASAWQYWYENGIVSGGLYGAKKGCQDYSLAPCEHHINGSRPACGDIVTTPTCAKTCSSNTTLNFTAEKTYGLEPYALSSIPRIIQLEIMKNGPVEASFDVFSDFPTYSSGVYQKSADAESVGGHAVKIIGWGVENTTPYWLIANSWNSDWGETGNFKMIRGINHCGIESNIVAGLPTVSSNGAILPTFNIFLTLVLNCMLLFVFRY